MGQLVNFGLNTQVIIDKLILPIAYIPDFGGGDFYNSLEMSKSTILIENIDGVGDVTISSLPSEPYSKLGEIKIIHNFDSNYNIILASLYSYGDGDISNPAGDAIDYILKPRSSVILQYVEDVFNAINVWQIISSSSTTSLSS